MAIESLFPGVDKAKIKISPMQSAELSPADAARAYEKLLPNQIDILLLTVGDDGHIASIFPGSKTVQEFDRLVVSSISPKYPYSRLTITPRVIKNARKVFVLAAGKHKKMIYEKALEDPSDLISMPVRLVLDRTWIFSDEW
jgi:6-phosphogluconolactonase